jgi:hypothetical protein
MLEPFIVDNVSDEDLFIEVPNIGRCRVSRFLVYDPSGKAIGTTNNLYLPTPSTVTKFDFILSKERE